MADEGFWGSIGRAAANHAIQTKMREYAHKVILWARKATPQEVEDICSHLEPDDARVFRSVVKTIKEEA